MKIMYEVECNRNNISPRQFFTYCKRQFAKKGYDLESWTYYEDWEKPIQESDNKWKHEDWDVPALEICKTKPYDIQFYLQGAYNFIMEWFDGHGYMYAIEYER